MNYDEAEYLAQQREQAAQNRHNELIGIICFIGVIFLFVFAKEQMLQGLAVLLGFGYIYCFFSYSWVRTATFFILGGLFVWIGDAQGKTIGYWVLGAAIVNSAIAQYRKHGTAFYSWWEELV